MRDGEGVAQVVRRFEKRLADNISYIPTPLKRGRPGLYKSNDLLTKDDECKFLQQLSEFKKTGTTCMTQKTQKCPKMINKHVRRKVNILKRIQQLPEKDNPKLTEFRRSHRYKHTTKPNS